jgi:membrane-bound serine protease (ClpP class)
MSGLVLTLLLLGFALVVAERRSPTYGVLRTLGLAALVAAVGWAVTGSAGTLVLALASTVAIAGPISAVGLFAWRLVSSASRRRARCGAEGLVGHVGVVRRPLNPVGHVAIDGELWRARRSWAEADETPPMIGEPVVVDHVRGLTLTVRRADVWEVEQ